MYHIFLLPVFFDRGWQFIADDCGVKYDYNAVGQNTLSIDHISNATYKGWRPTHVQKKRDRTLQLTSQVH